MDEGPIQRSEYTLRILSQSLDFPVSEQEATAQNRAAIAERVFDTVKHQSHDSSCGEEEPVFNTEDILTGISFSLSVQASASLRNF